MVFHAANLSRGRTVSIIPIAAETLLRELPLLISEKTAESLIQDECLRREVQPTAFPEGGEPSRLVRLIEKPTSSLHATVSVQHLDESGAAILGTSTLRFFVDSPHGFCELALRHIAHVVFPSLCTACPPPL